MNFPSSGTGSAVRVIRRVGGLAFDHHEYGRILNASLTTGLVVVSRSALKSMLWEDVRTSAVRPRWVVVALTG